ncbi:hypothetical protein [Pseudescherichia sp.]|uniref:hypothetical protein n=1 Tax=Pseudescherichia sp. TaxID=2055881 RepID=UPI00289DA57B|nr:hypothetical protein [Pseudescherichia sp.]
MTTTYTENDFFSYHTLPGKDIEKAPRISGDYYFKAQLGDGYAPTSMIIFKWTANVEPLRIYLKHGKERTAGAPEVITPLVTSAVVNREGFLFPTPATSIPRDLLEPLPKGSFSIGKIFR